MFGLGSKLLSHRGTMSCGGNLPSLLGLCPLQLTVINKINCPRSIYLTALKLIPEKKTTEFKKAMDSKIPRKRVIAVSVVILGSIAIYYTILYSTYTIIEKTVESTDK